jgi:uncharacterized protein YbjT (DUF2867 family)
VDDTEYLDKVLRAAEHVADELEEFGYVYDYEEAAENLREALGRDRIYRSD